MADNTKQHPDALAADSDDQKFVDRILTARGVDPSKTAPVHLDTAESADGVLTIGHVPGHDVGSDVKPNLMDSRGMEPTFYLSSLRVRPGHKVKIEGGHGHPQHVVIGHLVAEAGSVIEPKAKSFISVGKLTGPEGVGAPSSTIGGKAPSGVAGPNGRDGSSSPPGSGQSGSNGGDGGAGSDGQPAVSYSLHFNTISGKLTFICEAGDGGAGGTGGRGGNGGDASGHPGGNGGNGGSGGQGGDGGAGTTSYITYGTKEPNTEIDLQTFPAMGGLGGAGGAGGAAAPGSPDGNPGSPGNSGGNGREGSSSVIHFQQIAKSS